MIYTFLTLTFILLITSTSTGEVYNHKGRPVTKKVVPLSSSEVSKLFNSFDLDKHSLNAEQFAKKMSNENTVILDLRSSRNFNLGHVKNAINLDADASGEQLKKIIPSTETTILAYCTNSFEMTRMISLTYSLVPQIYALGYKNIFFLENYSSDSSQKKSPKETIPWLDLVYK